MESPHRHSREDQRVSPSETRRIALGVLRHRGACLGLVTVLLIGGMTVFAPLLAPYSPYSQDYDARFMPPSRDHWMGGDQLGRDILSRILYGGRISLTIGFLSIGISSITGTLAGLLGGYFGSWIDFLLMRIIDALLAFPGILLALVVIASLGPGIWNVAIAVGISQIPAFARLVRGRVLSIREETYIQASHAIGCCSFRILRQHILPNCIGPILVYATLQLGNSVFLASGLSFLGLGAQPPTPEWGLMASQGRQYLPTAWWVCIFPGLALAVVVLAVNLLGDGLRDVLDPRIRRP